MSSEPKQTTDHNGENGESNTPNFPSIFNDVIGPVMRGPSSSHTAGAFHIARMARSLLGGMPRRAVLIKARSRAVPFERSIHSKCLFRLSRCMAWHSRGNADRSGRQTSMAESATVEKQKPCGPYRLWILTSRRFSPAAWNDCWRIRYSVFGQRTTENASSVQR